MKIDHPLISCICITDNRPLLLRKSISYFENQNYPNKELVISYPTKDKRTKDVINSVLNEKELKILQIERVDNETVGNARNQAIARCRGAYICIWDDDDWYHASRLSFQFNSMQTTGISYHASILTRILLFDTITQNAYLSFSYTWDGSILCKKEIILQNQYAHLNKGEDTHIIKFLDSKKTLHYIGDSPFLYIYIYHGDNTWDYKHFEYFIKKSELLDEDTTNTIRNLIEWKNLI